ncbi:hypothetical protein HPB49_023470 [Dermacentor silvarum]|uniref:Uncharacterized protein n=1 Tax=Dermacentor silvarum TaxID=543639 RepID=A0ACB8DGI5_DERSI|nr:hypothetical protein HPB49_023470 [Dermacentor silvarum]
MVAKAAIVLSFSAFVKGANVFGGGNLPVFRGATFGFQATRLRGPQFGTAATPGFSSMPAASYPAQPYSFGYDNTDQFGTRLFHKEEGDASNNKRGSFGYRDANGLFRTVTYVADANGFRATVDTNEPGTAPAASADAVFNANPVAAPAVTSVAGSVVPGGFVEARPAAFGAGAGGYGAAGPWAG